MKIKSFFIVLIISLTACKKSVENKIVNSENKTYFSHKPKSYYYTYKDSKTYIENFDNGYIDTFSVSDTRFRLFSNPDSIGDLELEVLKNGKWYKNLKVHYGNNGSKALTDYNRDGFIDFETNFLRGSSVYFFDKVKKKFNTESARFAYEWAIIDSVHNIYSNYYELYGLNETDLFKLEGFEQTYLYTAPFEMKLDSGKVTLKLYKMDSKTYDTSYVFTKNYDLLHSDFDYKLFWKDFLEMKKHK